VSLTPKALQDLLDELEASRASRKRAWENLQEIRWVLKDVVGVQLAPPARKTIDLEGRIVKRRRAEDGQGSAARSRRTGEGNSGVPEVHRSTVDAARFRVRACRPGTEQGYGAG
jgi:hypothetical protein